jgi:hypothetical protein
MRTRGTRKEATTSKTAQEETAEADHYVVHFDCVASDSTCLLPHQQGDAWFRASVSVPAAAVASASAFRFRGVTGTGGASDMAIDDVFASYVWIQNGS